MRSLASAGEDRIIADGKIVARITFTATHSQTVIEHTKGEYVVGVIHTNTIEGFWSMIKRGVTGTFHKVSRKYLPLYVAEFEFRYNDRTNPDIFGTAIAGC